MLPPGTILQRMYLRRRLKARAPGRFVEVGTGTGDLAHMLLGLGWEGVGYELGDSAVEQARGLNAQSIASGAFELRQLDWLTEPQPPPADLFVSAMVLEHLPEADVRRFLEQAAAGLGERGLGILLVPASPSHWGIEDEVAGHERRYTRETLTATLRESGFAVTHLAGLTYPLSNLLLPISNRQVTKWETERTGLDAHARTVASGARTVPWKTQFPAPARLILNEATMSPLYGLQLLTRRSERALVLYAEWARA
jgi:SAM-dependent methyltransferase